MRGLKLRIDLLFHVTLLDPSQGARLCETKSVTLTWSHVLATNEPLHFSSSVTSKVFVFEGSSTTSLSQ